ncbi:MAG: hypothetical protein ACT4PX_02515 [Actinomycetota bacterium]
MYAMVGTSKLNFENPDDAAQMANGILSTLRGAPGFVTGSFARSTDGNHGRSMILFGTEEQARAAAESARASIPADGPVEIVSIEVYEVVAHA